MADILIVDDEPDILMVLTEILNEGNNRKIITASNGEEAYKIITDYTPEVAWVDYQMPKLDGLTLYLRLKSEGIALPTSSLLMTATNFSDSLKLKREIYQLGFKGIITKPFELRTITTITTELLSNAGKSPTLDTYLSQSRF